MAWLIFCCCTSIAYAVGDVGGGTTDPPVQSGYSSLPKPSAWLKLVPNNIQPPTDYTFQARFQTFFNQLQGSSLFSVVNSVGMQGIGDGSHTMQVPVYGQTVEYDFDTWGTGVFQVLRGIVLIGFCWISIKILTLKRT
jgi:hypothetical protein